MVLTVSRDRIKERCGLTTTDFDDAIDNLISDLQPAIEFSVQEAFLNDTSNAGLQSLLTYAALEILTGEFLCQLWRAPGASEKISICGLTLDAPEQPDDQVAKGWERLKPFLKTTFQAGLEAGVRTAPKVLS